jgi:hypothetical protein
MNETKPTLREDALAHHPKPKMEKPCYQFEWCAKCTLLRGCYYQHGDLDGPKYLEPACGEGPA